MAVGTTACEKNTAEVIVHETPPLKKMQSYVRGEVLVKFKTFVSPDRIAAILKETHTEIISQITGTTIYHLRILDDASVESVIQKLTELPEVEYAEPNRRYQLQK